MISTTTSADVYINITGDWQGRLLRTNARDFMQG